MIAVCPYHYRPPSLSYSMHKQQLRRHARDLIRLISFQREIPERQLVIRGHAEHRGIVRRPLHGSDGCLQIVEAAHEASTTGRFFCPALLQIANIPDTEGAVVGPRDHQISHLPTTHVHTEAPLVPVEHIHIAAVRLDGQHAVMRAVSRVPDPHRAIHRAGSEHGTLRRTPLNVLDRIGVVLEGGRIGGPSALHRTGDVDQTGAVACGEKTLLAHRPVQRVALRAVAFELVDGVGRQRGTGERR